MLPRLDMSQYINFESILFLAELYVASVYLNLFGWRIVKSMKDFKGAQAIKVLEPLVQK
jgi:hypothetical protein